MRINFFIGSCQNHSNAKIFGLCDVPKHLLAVSEDCRPAYIDESNGATWIAVVENDARYEVTFTAIDCCIDIRRPDNKLSSRCDGMLTYARPERTVIFVELKSIDARDAKSWIKTAEAQLRTTIGHFEQQDEAEDFQRKEAYIANSEHPRFRESQIQRMNNFHHDTGYVLRIVNRIKL